MSNPDEIKRALVNMIAEVTSGESIHGAGLTGSQPIDMFGPYFMVTVDNEKHYFEIVLNEVDEEKFDVTENYQP